MAPTVPKLEEELKWLYIAEGAANVVYKIWYDLTFTTTQGEDIQLPASTFDGYFLRVRKDLPTTIPCVISQCNFDRVFRPLFKAEHLVDQKLVDIKSSRIIEKLNGDLQKWERGEKLSGKIKAGLPDVRPTKRNGKYLANDDHGLLVTDMSSRGKNVLVVEFKPKWLLQSPSAPKASLRCRTCAKKARHDAKEKNKGRPTNATETQEFCPLDLISTDPRVLYNVACQILAPSVDFDTVLRLVRWLQESELIHDLLSAQKIDDKGVLEGSVDDLLVAMTLRDCSLYLHLPRDPSMPIEARLGDLDLKSRDKAESWKEAERRLIEDGWYEGVEKAEPKPPNCCALNRNRILQHTPNETQLRELASRG